MSMCFKEKLKLAPNVITDIITSANQDIRLIINHLSMLAVENSKLANSTKHIKMVISLFNFVVECRISFDFVLFYDPKTFSQ